MYYRLIENNRCPLTTTRCSRIISHPGVDSVCCRRSTTRTAQSHLTNTNSAKTLAPYRRWLRILWEWRRTLAIFPNAPNCSVLHPDTLTSTIRWGSLVSPPLVQVLVQQRHLDSNDKTERNANIYTVHHVNIWLCTYHWLALHAFAVR